MWRVHYRESDNHFSRRRLVGVVRKPSASRGSKPPPRGPSSAAEPQFGRNRPPPPSTDRQKASLLTVPVSPEPAASGEGRQHRVICATRLEYSKASAKAWSQSRELRSGSSSTHRCDAPVAYEAGMPSALLQGSREVPPRLCLCLSAHRQHEEG